jgi:rod shape-determining protein MreC
MGFKFKSRTTYKKVISIAVLIVLAIVFSFRGLVSSVVEPVAVPLVQFGSWMSSHILFWQDANLITAKELRVLHDRIDALAVDGAQIEALIDENETLKAQVGFIERTEFVHVTASILSKNISSTVNRFIINVGLNDGVSLGSAVVADGGIFVGKVTDISARSATVTGLTDPVSAVAVSLLNDRRTIGVAGGTLGDLLEIKFIPVDEIVKTHDLVVTSGLEESVPSGLLIGIVNTVEHDVGVPFQTAVVEPLIDIRRVFNVLVLLNEGVAE